MSTQRSQLRTIAYGAAAGVVASLAMAAFAMVAAWQKGTGFFTPLHHIASLVASEDSMMASMTDAMAGHDFHVVLGTALLGATTHMMTGALYGAVFGVIASRLGLSPGVLVAAGVLYGAIVFATSAFVGLPLVAAVLGSGDSIRNMAELAGWGTFVTEHLIFGAVVGILSGMTARGRAAVADPVQAAAG